MNRYILPAVLAAVLAIGAYFALTPPTTTSSSPLGSASAQELADIDTSSVVEMQIGNADAPVTVIEYASFTCPHCATFHQGPFKQLKADYIDTGKINFIYREVYFDPFGLRASAIARCAGPEKFFGITDMIYAGQSDWARQQDPEDITEGLRRIGRLAGMDNETIDTCLEDDNLRPLVAWYQQNAEADGISSTPSFVINGETYSNMSYDRMSEIIDEAAES